MVHQIHRFNLDVRGTSVTVITRSSALQSQILKASASTPPPGTGTRSP